MNITIRFDRPRQTLSGFGVSGAWWAQEVGGFTETDPASGLPVRERAARLLFSREEGIGITQYRYNLGAGSKESGRGRFDQENRRAECFETSPGVYDWSKDENAVWMLKEAVRLGAEEITLFANSPPERLTRNHKAHLDRPLATNLPKKNYEAFARYVLDCAAHFLAEGIPIKYVSPINEPVWVWTGSQEGCHYRPLQGYALLRVFARRLRERPALSGVKLSGAENGDIRWFNKTWSRIMLSKTLRAVSDGVDVHSYFLPVPSFLPAPLRKVLDDRLAYLKRFRRWLDRRNASVRVSEWCHMRGGRDCGMGSALVQARVMAEDLSLLEAEGWQLWIAMSNYDYCDGLIYYDGEETLTLTKRLFAFGNFSRFVRPGAVRLETEGAGSAALAFSQNGETALVLRNGAASPESVRTNLSGPGVLWVTDETRDLAPTPVADRGAFTLPPRSVCTLTADAE